MNTGSPSVGKWFTREATLEKKSQLPALMILLYYIC